MKRLFLPCVIAAALAACGAASEGQWPSLAMRAGEVQPLVPRPAVASISAPAAAAGRARDDADARLISLERDISALTERIGAQRAATARAATAAAGQASELAAGAAAQIEVSRAERLASQAGDLRDRLDALAGDVALRSVDGDDATGVLPRIGAAIARVEALRAR